MKPTNIFSKVDAQLGPTESIKIPVGSRVFCPGCGTALYSVVHEVSIVSLRFRTNFVSLTEHEVSKCPFICPVCRRLILNSLGRYTYVISKEPVRSRGVKRS